MITARYRLAESGCVWDTAQLLERSEEAPGMVRVFQYTTTGRLPLTIKRRCFNCTGFSG